MANGTLSIAIRRDWPLANPWLWLAVGLGVTAAAWGWARANVHASDCRAVVVALGLLATGVGCWLRWRDRDNAFLQSWAPPLALLARFVMGLLFLFLGLGLILLFGVACFYGNRPEFYPGVAFFACLTISPVTLAAARQCLTRAEKQATLDATEETGVAFVVAGGVCVLGWFALWNGSVDWDTIRLFLRALAGVCFVGAALAIVSTLIRRATLSLLFVLHFTAIANACLTPDPAPWIVKQAWVRLSRPYLEFMYLNNAYHFYAPEPTPVHYLWFRVIFATPEGDQGLWYKVPDLDDEGNIRHPIALEYQRFLAMTSSVEPDAPLPPESYFDVEKGQFVRHPIYQRRNDAAPPTGKVVVVGVQPFKGLRIPFDPQLHWTTQIRIPAPTSRQLLSSYAGFVARKFARHPEHRDWEFKSVKAYRVTHLIPPSGALDLGIPPTDPSYYRAFYAGTYDTDGNQREDQDPYLYWMLPSLRVNPNDPYSEIKDYCRLHAGDPNWRRVYIAEDDTFVWIPGPQPPIRE